MCFLLSSLGLTSKHDSHREKTALLLASPRFYTKNEEYNHLHSNIYIPMYKNYIHYKYNGTLSYGHLW